MNQASSKKISFKIDWLDTVQGIESKTLAKINLLIDEIPAWPTTGEETDEFEWFADELLAHLTECWKPLILRQTYPIPSPPERPSYLLVEATKRWASQPEELVDVEQTSLEAFEDTHNLANAFGGISGLLPLWFLRDRDRMIVDTQERVWSVPFESAFSALESAGNKIADRLRSLDNNKWGKLVTAWEQRDKGDPTNFLALAVGLDRSTTETLIQRQLLDTPKSLIEATNDNDELRIAARMAGPLPLNQLTKVIEHIRSCPHSTASRLARSAVDAKIFLQSESIRDARPHVQGEELARWLRRYLNVSPTFPIDPFRTLSSQGIDCRVIDFGFRSLFAIAVWGPKYGPAVLLNSDQSKIASLFRSVWQNGFMRVNAAHELCHLLADAEHSFSAVDVLNGRMPLRIEQRARAFAAEFLLPSNEAGALWRSLGSSYEIDTVRQVIRKLCGTFKVTEAVASWQLEHGVGSYHREVLTHVLDQIVPHR